MKPFVNDIGYACMNSDIEPNKYRTCRKDKINDGVLRELIEENLNVLEGTIDYNIKNKNKMFRVSSSLIPFGSSPLNTLDWAKEFEDNFKRIRNKIESHDIRISMHPGQYTVINSPDSSVVNNSIEDLRYHAKVISLLAPSKDSKMILHVGGVYGDREAALKRFVEVYTTRLDQDILKHLVIENDHYFTVEDVLWIASRVSVPVVFDNLHHDINPSLLEYTIEEIVKMVENTWNGDRPKFHYSQQATGKRVGAHSATINLDLFIKDYNRIFSHIDADIMLEVKEKNRSFLKVNQYFNHSQKVMEEEWARYKYWVMSKSQDAYNSIRSLFKDNQDVSSIEFYRIIDSLYDLEMNVKAEINALSHAWGYFKRIATPKEKDTYMSLLDQKNIFRLKAHLRRMALKYQVDYLRESYYLK